MIKKIIEICKDPKKRSLIAFPAYFLFFVLVFTVFRFKAPENGQIDNNNLKTTSYQNYTSLYKINFTNDSDEPNKSMTINSKRYHNMEDYQLAETGEDYFREDDTLYLDNKKVDNFSIDLPKLTQEYIEKYIMRGEEIYKTEYNDGTVEKAYEISLSSFSELYGEKTLQDGVVKIKVKKQNNQIENVYLDMSTYYFVKIEINYSNYGDVKEEDVLGI